MIYKLLADRLQLLQILLHDLPEDKYREASTMLGHATIGQHVRHILEMLKCLKDGYAIGKLNYDDRKRDTLLENNKQFSRSLIAELLASMRQPNKAITIAVTVDENQTVEVQSSYIREIAYNLEHTVHHMAMIQVALREMKLSLVHDDFGKAYATIRHLKTLQA